MFLTLFSVCIHILYADHEFIKVIFVIISPDDFFMDISTLYDNDWTKKKYYLILQ